MFDSYTDDQLRDSARKPRTRAVIEEALADEEAALAKYQRLRDAAQESLDRTSVNVARLRQVLDDTAGERAL